MNGVPPTGSKDNNTYKKRISELQEERASKENQGFASKAFTRGRVAYSFVASDIWRLRDDELEGFRGGFIRFLRVISISLTEFMRQNISQKASALTFKFLLSLVPVLAILLSIAGGFGLQDSVQRQLYQYFPAHQEELTMTLGFVESYMNQIQGGLVIGIGIAVLFYTVFTLLIMVEDVINDIWQVRQVRPISKRLISYFSGFIILPFIIILSSGANVFISSLSSLTLLGDISLSPFISFLMRLLPFVFWVIIFTSFYLLMPNTRVRFWPAFIAALISGASFQAFQLVYISGQLWVTKYNSIYGSFAALPLLMLFIQLSWIICLFGAQLAYAIQNSDRYVFKEESEHVSRRFRDFVALILMQKICKNFRTEIEPYNAEQLAEECDLPIVIVSDTLTKLVECRLLRENPTHKGIWAPTYTPAIDIATITVCRVLSAMDRLGAENFRMEIYDQYADEWEIVRKSRHIQLPELDMQVADI